MPKTGTKTLASALRTLGYNVYDLEEQFYFLGKDLIEITNSGWTANDIKRIFTDVDAVTDVMSNCLWEEIFRVFPDAKVRIGFQKRNFGFRILPWFDSVTMLHTLPVFETCFDRTVLW